MASSRDTILRNAQARVAHLRGQASPSQEERRAVLSALTSGLPSDRTAHFVERARASDAAVSRLSSVSEVPAALADLISGAAEPTVCVPDAGALRDLPWAEAGVRTARAPSSRHDDASAIEAAAGVAESGSLVISAASHDTPQAMLLSGQTVVVLFESAIATTFEDALRAVRSRGLRSRVVFLTGPSRTGDIASRLVIPAQGPRRIHILVVEEDGS